MDNMDTKLGVNFNLDLDDDDGALNDQDTKVTIEIDLKEPSAGPSNVPDGSICGTLDTLRRFSLEHEIKQEVLSDNEDPLSESTRNKFASEVYVGYSSGEESSTSSDDNYFPPPEPILQEEEEKNEIVNEPKKRRRRKVKEKKEKVTKQVKPKREKRQKKEKREKREKPEDMIVKECKMCGEKFTALKPFRRHLHMHFESKTCAICLVKMENLDELEEHVDTHICNYVCKICGQTFMRSANLTRHERQCVPQEGPIQCEHCGKIFKLRRRLRQHVLLHTPIRPFKCQYCGRCFRINSRLKEHEKTHFGIKPYKCAICGKPFSSMSDTKKHEKRHEKPNFRPANGDKDRNRIAKCMVCNTEVINLRAHMMKHYETVNNSCGICGKTMKSTKALLSHMKIHEGNPFECDICLRRFNRKNNMMMHRERHGMEGYRAKIMKSKEHHMMLTHQISNLI